MRAALLALAALAAPSAAQAPATRQIRVDISPAGQAIVKKYLGASDPVIAQRMAQLRGVAQQLTALSSAPKLDLARMEALMRQQEAAQAAMQRRSNERTLAMLRELSEADRTKFMRSFRPAPNAR